MVTSMLALNAILMFSVVAAIVSLLAWAIRTQHRDHHRTPATVERAVTAEHAARPVHARTRSTSSQARRRPAAGRV